MPIYKFRCNDCGEEFSEIVVSKGEIKCSHCGSTDIEKQPVTSFSIQFNGKGFYRTDYKKGDEDEMGE